MLISSSVFRFITLFRKIKEQDGLDELAIMLKAVADDTRPWWRPWYEAVAALATGQGADACTTDEARALHERLSE